MLERSRLIQQCSTDCFSPEPLISNGINKSVSSSDVKNTENFNYGLSKSISGGNINQANGKQSSSPSEMSTPSNNSHAEEVKYAYIRGYS